MLSHPQKQGHEFIFKVGDSTWSKVWILYDVDHVAQHICVFFQPVSFEAPAAETGMVIASQAHRGTEFHIGLSWSEGIGKYKLSKVITITPRFLIKNGLPNAIAFREHGAAPKERSLIEPGQRCTFQLFRTGNEKLLTVAYPGLNAQWY